MKEPADQTGKEGQADKPKPILRTGVQIAAEMGFSTTYMSAVRHAMGLHGKSRFMLLEQVRDWLLAHPEFKVEHVYRRKTQGTSGKSA